MSRLTAPANTMAVLADVAEERVHQHRKWGPQNHLDGCGSRSQALLAMDAREACETAFAAGGGTWAHILSEEVCEAFAESEPLRLREELVHVAAVAVAWCEAIDRRLASARAAA